MCLTDLFVDALVCIREYLCYESKQHLKCLCWTLYKKLQHGVSVDKRRKESISYKFENFKNLYNPECFLIKVYDEKLKGFTHCNGQIFKVGLQFNPKSTNGFTFSSNTCKTSRIDLNTHELLKFSWSHDYTPVNRPILIVELDLIDFNLGILYDFLPYYAKYHEILPSKSLKIEVCNWSETLYLPFIVQCTLQQVFAMDREKFCIQIKHRLTNYTKCNNIHYEEYLEWMEDVVNVTQVELEQYPFKRRNDAPFTKDCGLVTFSRYTPIYTTNFEFVKINSLVDQNIVGSSIPTIEELTKFTNFIVEASIVDSKVLLHFLCQGYERVTFHYYFREPRNISLEEVKHLLLALICKADTIVNQEKLRTLVLE